MQSLPAETNPFALMIDPQSVLARIGCSERLERLQRHVCRPLDKVGLEAAPDGAAVPEGGGEPALPERLLDDGPAVC